MRKIEKPKAEPAPAEDGKAMPGGGTGIGTGCGAGTLCAGGVPL